MMMRFTEPELKGGASEGIKWAAGNNMVEPMATETSFPEQRQFDIVATLCNYNMT